jgi:uncharacterized protein (TIGR02001 family)
MALLNKLAGGVLAAGLALGAVAAPASAEDKFGYSITLTGVSDYLFRGISLTNESPAFQPYVEGTYGMFYLGFWGSNIDAPYGPYEVDVYAGIRPTTGPVSWDIGVLYYAYPGAHGPAIDALDGGEYVEFKIAASVTPVTNLTLGITGYYTPDADNAYSETESIEGLVSYALPQFLMFSPTLSAGIGYTNATNDAFFLGEDSYTYWNVGVKLTVEKFFMDLRYWDTNINENAVNGFNTDLADARFLFSAGVTLP